MLLEEYDLKLMQLRKIYDRLEDAYNTALDESETLEMRLEELENEMQYTEKQIKTLKNQIINVKKESNEMEDTFNNNFIKASLFACEDPLRDRIYGVNLTENKIMATDGTKGIIIKCVCIPDNLKNTRINWYARDNFEDNIIAPEEKFYDFEQFLKKCKKAKKYTIDKINSHNFFKMFNAKNTSKYETLKQIELSHEELKILFNKELLDLALMCMGDKEFTVYLADDKSPMILEHDEISTIIMPMRR